MKLGSKQKERQLILIRIGIGLLVVCCVLVAMSTIKRYQIAADMKERRSVIEQQRAELEERKAHLKEKVDYLEDERSVEAEIRRNFDVAKEGEQVVIILEDSEEESDSRSIETPEQITPWYSFWR